MDTIQVHQTKDYALFKNVDGNRQINDLHKKRLKKSMEEKYLINPIIVNEKHEIIDGQHRFQSAKELGYPIYYLQIEGYSLGDVQRMNQNAKNWTSLDFLDAYCDLGYDSYLRFRDFLEQYDFPFSVSLSIAIGTGYSRDHTNDFMDGKWEFTDQFYAEDRATKITALKAYTPLYNQRFFVYALLTLFKKQEFEYSQFMQKLSYQQAVLVKCSTVTQYITLIEEIYNFKSRNKVNLRY